jgi:hypothetical protein
MMIDRVGQHEVKTIEQLREALKGMSLEQGILLLVRTPKGTQFVSLRKEN